MANKDDRDKLDDLRARLYARDSRAERAKRHSLKKDASRARAVNTNWETPAPEHTDKAARTRSDAHQGRGGEEAPTPPAGAGWGDSPASGTAHTTPPSGYTGLHTMPRSSARRNSVRKRLLLAGVAFFVFAVGLASLFLFFGNNTISGENISIEINGPFAVGGGEKATMQVSIANNNAVPIEAATLILEYPEGTQSASEPGKDVFVERQPLNVIEPGQVVNVPVEVIVFGEENEEKTIAASIEYRVRGSNATFFKEAEDLRFKISSSPVVVNIDSVERISSGQETDIELTVRSNAPTELTDILVKAEYPFGFEFSDAAPSTASGEDTWIIESLEPEEETTITITGTVVGKQDEERVFNFSVGVPSERDRFTLASVYNTGSTEIAIEQPFLGIAARINQSTEETVVIGSGERSNVSITFENTLEDTIYDGSVEVALSGNALDDLSVDAGDGFYDSSSQTVRWDHIENPEFEEIEPGRSRDVNFYIEPSEDIARTPEITMSVTARGQRVFENRVPQELKGSLSRTIKVASVASLNSQTHHEEGPFNNSGPTPPEAEEVTEYTLNFILENGSNDITDAEMTATLPSYVTWLNAVSPEGAVTYNQTSRQLTWNIDDLDAGSRTQASVQVSLLPSRSQIGTVPTLVEAQRFEATDRFTGTTIRSQAPALTTELYDDRGADEESGKVVE